MGGDWEKRKKGEDFGRKEKRERILGEKKKGRGFWEKRKKGEDFCTCHASGYKGILSLANILQIVFVHCVVFFAFLAISLGRSFTK